MAVELGINTDNWRLEDRGVDLCIRRTAELAAAARGEPKGIAASPVAIGDGVNADNIRACVDALNARNFGGVCALECTGDELTEESVAWFAKVIA